MPRLNREESRQQTRARLLDSAQHVFALHGFAGASLDEIADHAGYSKGAVYSNFESKEALFLELLNNHMKREETEVRELLDRNATFPEILKALKQRYSTPEGKIALALLSTEFQLHASRHPEFAEPFAALYRQQRIAIAELLRSMAHKVGVPVPSHLKDHATSLIALSHGISMQRAADPDSVPPGAAGRAIETFLSAILK
jgi:AcrR family transcriptional regulator